MIMTIKDIYGHDPFPSLTGNQGWICPKCGRVYAPGIPTCFHCNQMVDAAPVSVEPKEDKVKVGDFPGDTSSVATEDISPASIIYDGPMPILKWLEALNPHTQTRTFTIADSEAWRYRMYR